MYDFRGTNIVFGSAHFGDSKIRGSNNPSCLLPVLQTRGKLLVGEVKESLNQQVALPLENILAKSTIFFLLDEGDF